MPEILIVLTHNLKKTQNYSPQNKNEIRKLDDWKNVHKHAQNLKNITYMYLLNNEGRLRLER